MSWNPPPGQDPNQPNPSQYGGYTPQPNPTDPYSGGQQPGSGYQQPGYQQPGAGYQQPGAGYQQPGAGYGQQQSGYQQPGYQPPYGVPPPGMGAPAGPLGPTSIGMQANVAAGLSYVFVWLSGLIIFLLEKQNRFVRFHAMQSLIFFGSLTVIRIALTIIDAFGIPFLGIFTFLIGLAVVLVWFVGWIVLMINGFQGKYFKLPIIGDYAERYANQGTGTML